MNCINDRLPGWMSTQELIWLHAQAMQSTSIVEIGCWKGRSTYALLTGCEGTVYAVDHFQGSVNELDTTHAEAKTRDIHADFMANVGWFPNLSVMKMSSAMASKQFVDLNVQADMVFIDGEHTTEAVLADIAAWAPLTSRILCGHDSYFPEVAEALGKSNVLWHRGSGSIWYSIKGEDF